MDIANTTDLDHAEKNGHNGHNGKQAKNGQNGHGKAPPSGLLADLANAVAMAVVESLQRASSSGTLPDDLSKLFSPSSSDADVEAALFPAARKVFGDSLAEWDQHSLPLIDDEALVPKSSVESVLEKRIDLQLIPDLPTMPAKSQRLDLEGYLVEYEEITKLDEDDCGEIILGRSRATGADVLIRVLNKHISGRKSYIEHAKNALKGFARLDHPNLLKVIAHGMHQGSPYFVTGTPGGKLLTDIIGHNRSMTELDTLRLCVQIAEGLQHAYQKMQLTHGELRPSSILVTHSGADHAPTFGENDSIRVSDFLHPPTPWHDREHLSQMAIPQYVAPERLNGPDNVPVWSDIYAIGAIMYRLLTGVAPYTGTPDEVRAGHLTKPVPDPGDRVPELSPRTRDIVCRALSKDPKDRFLTFQGFIVACRKSFKGLTGLEAGTTRIVRKDLRKTISGTFAKPPTVKIPKEADLEKVSIPNEKKAETPAEAAERERAKTISRVYHFMSMGTSDAFNTPRPLALAEARRLQEVVARIMQKWLIEKQAGGEMGKSEGNTTKLIRKIDSLLNQGVGDEAVRKVSTRIIRSNMRRWESQEGLSALVKRSDETGTQRSKNRTSITWGPGHGKWSLQAMLNKSWSGFYFIGAAVFSIGIGVCLANLLTAMFKLMG
jgi:serine/threonine protein kinase